MRPGLVAVGTRVHLAGTLGEQRSSQALVDLLELPVIRYPHDDLIGRAWTMRAALTAYDAMYIALAEALDATVVTCDARMGRAHGHQAQVDVVGLAS